jgi:Outer membrane protein beta-barrel domain
MSGLTRSFFPLPSKQKYRCQRIVVLIMLLFSMRAESQQTINLPAYNRRNLHFGFIIAGNTASFYIDPASNLAGKFKDTLRTIRSVPQVGFDLGIVTEVALTKYIKLRFVPSLGFSDRQIAYSFLGVDTFTVTKDIQSVFLNFPLDLKLISKRLNNFEAYVIAGGKYATDLASQSDVNQQLAGARATVRLQRNDWYYEAGGGIEFYLQFFKFGIELKVSQGLRNLIIPDNTVYTESINGLYSKTYLLSLTFEG